MMQWGRREIGLYVFACGQCPVLVIEIFMLLCPEVKPARHLPIILVQLVIDHRAFCIYFNTLTTYRITHVLHIE